MLCGENEIKKFSDLIARCDEDDRIHRERLRKLRDVLGKVDDVLAFMVESGAGSAFSSSLREYRTGLSDSLAEQYRRDNEESVKIVDVRIALNFKIELIRGCMRYKKLLGDLAESKPERSKPILRDLVRAARQIYKTIYDYNGCIDDQIESWCAQLGNILPTAIKTYSA